MQEPKDEQEKASPSTWRYRLVNLTARKPSGWLGKLMYSHPWGHYRAFRLILERLDLKPGDHYLELAQGGGVLLNWALKTVEKAAAVDHSPDMVAAAIRKSQQAVDQGRVVIVRGNADSLPWAEGAFTCAACCEAFFFFENPEQVLAELYRVLRQGGRLAIATAPWPEKRWVQVLYGPWIRDLRLYTNRKFEKMLRQAGFNRVAVETVDRFRQIAYAEKP